MEEVWKRAPGHKDYEVSDCGRVRSWKRGKPEVMKPYTVRGGYWSIDFCERGRYTKYRINRLVLSAFKGHGAGLDACHRNGDRKDNRLENLYWGTRAENMADTLAHGTRSRGSRNGHARLNEDSVREIRKLAAGGNVTQAEIARRFGIAPSAVSRAVSGVTWGHVTA